MRILLPLLLCAVASAQTVDRKFLAVVGFNAVASFADSYTTVNYDRARCDTETGAPWLYGEHPAPARAYAVAGGKALLGAGLGYWLKRRRVRAVWAAPALFLAGGGVRGTINNVRNCR